MNQPIPCGPLRIALHQLHITANACHIRPPVQTKKAVKFTPSDIAPADCHAHPTDLMKLKEVDHLCKVITGRQTKKCCLGFTLDDQTMLRGAYNVSNGRAGPTTDLIVEDSITLEQLLLYKIRPPAPTTRDDANQLVMTERLALAANLASSLLQLHETPWLNSIWTKKDIHFVRTYQQPSAGRLVRAYRPVDAKQPFVSHDFVVRHDIAHAPNADESVPPPVHGNFSLLALGIILLELYFNEPIENKRLPEDLTDGKVDSSTDMNVATRWL